MNLIYTRTQPPKRPRIEEDLKTPERLQMELDACGASIERDIPKTTGIIKCMISGGTGEFCVDSGDGGDGGEDGKGLFNFYVSTSSKNVPDITHQSEWNIDMATNPSTIYLHFALLDDPRNDDYDEIHIDLEWDAPGGTMSFTPDYTSYVHSSGYYTIQLMIKPEYLNGLDYKNCQIYYEDDNGDKIGPDAYTGSISFTNVLPKVPVRYDDINEGYLVFSLPTGLQAGDTIVFSRVQGLNLGSYAAGIEITDEYIQNGEIHLEAFKTGSIVLHSYLKTTDRGIGYLSTYEHP